MKHLIFLYLLFTNVPSYSQTCEKFNRSYFHFLPKYVPDTINCKDSNGKKQGWWIYYNVDYHATALPNIYDSGSYVGSYRYGQYKDDKMLGNWIKFQNIHQCYEERVDSFYYKKDTVGVLTYTFFKDKYTVLEFINDSSIINAKSVYKKDTIYVYCNKNRGCKVMHCKNVIKVFPFGDIETTFFPAFEQICSVQNIYMFTPKKHDDAFEFKSAPK